MPALEIAAKATNQGTCEGCRTPGKSLTETWLMGHHYQWCCKRCVTATRDIWVMAGGREPVKRRVMAGFRRKVAA